MANLLQSTQTTATTVPQFYTDYLANLAARGQAAQQAAQYVGAQPLQTQAFEKAGQTTGAFQPAMTTGQQFVQQAAGQDITGAAAPYLSAGTAISPLSAFAPFAGAVAATSPAELASQYMNPYIQSAVQSMSDIAQRNIRQNLSPQATAAAVGTGQYGSQRGAQVLGQVQAQAEQDLNSQIAQMLSSGYGQALTAAGQRQALLGQLGSTASTAQQAYNQALLQAGQTAGSLTGQQAQALQQAGLGMGTLGSQAQGMNLADINALATLGEQQRQIAQGQQTFPLSTLASLANVMQGAQVPTTVTAQLNASPLSVLAGAGTGLLGLMTPRYDSSGKEIPNSRPIDYIKKTMGNIFSSVSGIPSLPQNVIDAMSVADAGGQLTPEQLRAVYDQFGITSTSQLDQYGQRIYNDDGTLTSAGYAMLGLDPSGNPFDMTDYSGFPDFADGGTVSDTQSGGLPVTRG